MINHNTVFSFFPHQVQAINKAVESKTTALFIEMGLGKTLISLSIILYRNLVNGVKRVLIVSPKTVAESWIKDCKEKIIPKFGYWLSIDIKNIASMSKEEAIDVLFSPKRSYYDLIIDVVNFEKLLSLENLPYYDMLIIDESTKIKNPNAQRTKKIIGSFINIPYRIILTGSPVVRDVSDMWSQLVLINAVKIDFSEFKKRFKKEKSIQDMINGNIITIMKKDINNLVFPEKKYLTLKTFLTQEGRIEYDKVKKKVEKEFLIGNKKKVLSSLIEMQRITSGFNPRTLTEFKVNPKKQLLDIVVEEFEHPLLIWATFVSDILMIDKYLREMGLNGKCIYGKTPSQERKEIIDSFQSGKLNYLVAHPVTLGIGTTLVASNVCVYYSNSFRLEDRIQSEDRIHRLNQEKDVCYYVDLVVSGTIDEKILQNIARKKDISKLSVEELKMLV